MESNLDNAKIGDGVTYCGYSDRQAGTIIHKTATTIIMRRDKATLLNGMNSDAEDKLVAYTGGFAAHVEGKQRYSYEADPKGQTMKFSRRVLRSGKVVWKMKGAAKSATGCSLIEGRHEHYDYNF